MSLEQTIERRWEAIGFDHLWPEERDYLRLWWLVAELNNGGFHQYFANDTANDAILTLAALQRISAHRTHQLLSEAVAFFGVPYPINRDERVARMESAPEFRVIEQRLSSAFYNDDEPLLEPALSQIQLLYEQQDIPIT